MKALVRDTEVYREEQWSDFTKNHLEWHTTASPNGDNYALAVDVPDDAEASDFDIHRIEKTVKDMEGNDTAIVVLGATLNESRYAARISEESA